MIRMMGWFELWMYVSLSIQPPICLSIREPFLSRKQDILMELSTRVHWRYVEVCIGDGRNRRLAFQVPYAELVDFNALGWESIFLLW